MCGIAGILDLKQRPVARRDLVRMTDAIAHRGPDGEGHHTDGPLGLGHRRLAVLDLSAAGRQPMASESGRYVLTYNGEIYNFADLRLELQTLGHRFNSQTDTEVLLCAFEEWGESCIERLNGMFAFAIWDMKERSLLLVRDRYGIKPLYYHHDGNAFVFASEVKALLTHPDISTRVCSEALSEYFTFQNIFTDLTLFDGVRLLPAGCTMRIDAKGRAPVQRRYWDYRFDSSGFDMSAEDATAQVRYLFEQAVTRQLVADVPVGSYLSGGIDSGAITAVASRHIPRLHTFTGG
ncbi:MAG: asparagine synthase (glutamine-hydrolyzing), partial [Planctomycetota bacterium]